MKCHFRRLIIFFSSGLNVTFLFLSFTKHYFINNHYVKGHDIFQSVSIFIYESDTKSNLLVDIIYNILW